MKTQYEVASKIKATEPAELEGYAGVREVARFLSKTPNYIYENSHPSLPKPIPCLRKGKYLWFKLSQVERWLEETAQRF